MLVNVCIVFLIKIQINVLGMGGGGMPPGFFPNSSLRPSPPAPHPGSQPSPHGPQPQLMGTGQPFIGPWYSGGPRSAVRMGMGNDFNGPPGMI